MSEIHGKIPIKVCRICGYEATIEVELTLFKKSKRCRYGVASICKECSNTKDREQYKTHKYKQKLQTKKRYGCTIEEYENRMSTSSVCEICNSTTELCYDHDHDTMKFRGVLCRGCNRSLGQLGDNIESIEKVLKYLKGNK